MGLEGFGVQASRPTVSGGPVKALGEDQKPQAPGDEQVMEFLR
jgi:hypothetical protein